MVRLPVFDGSFYPADPTTLREDARRFVEAAATPPSEGKLRAIVAPHAGYVYSGPIAGTAYRTLRDSRESPERVLLLGPSHRVAFSGIALPSHDGFRTPLGELEIDPDLRRLAARLPGVQEFDEAHAREHSLEVQLPFLQVVAGAPRILPLVVGSATPDAISNIVRSVLDEHPDTLVVVSSDFSHFLPYGAAVAVDRESAGRLERLETSIEPDQACGCQPLNGLTETARRSGWAIRLLDLRNSGDTCGDRSRVVGYGAFAAWSKE